MGRDPFDAAARHTAPPPTSVERVQARLEGSPAQAGSSRPFLAVGAVVLAAALGLAWIFVGPETPTELERLSAQGAGEVATTGEAGGEGPWRPLAGVEVRSSGDVRVADLDGGLLLEVWTGHADVEVDASAGLVVAVETREARVEVVGTGFRVTRSEAGTDVEVGHGIVAVQCAGAAPAELLAGASLHCPAVTAASLLGRLRRQQLEGAPESDLELLLRAGLDRATPGTTVELELRLVQVQLAAADDPVAALDLLEGVLADGAGHRQVQALVMGARLAYSEGGCTGAARWLERLEVGEASAQAEALGCSWP